MRSSHQQPIRMFYRRCHWTQQAKLWHNNRTQLSQYIYISSPRIRFLLLTGVGSLLQGESRDNHPNPLNDFVPQLFVNPGVSVPGGTLGCGALAILTTCKRNAERTSYYYIRLENKNSSVPYNRCGITGWGTTHPDGAAYSGGQTCSL